MIILIQLLSINNNDISLLNISSNLTLAFMSVIKYCKIFVLVALFVDYFIDKSGP